MVADQSGYWQQTVENFSILGSKTKYRYGFENCDVRSDGRSRAAMSCCPLFRKQHMCAKSCPGFLDHGSLEKLLEFLWHLTHLCPAPQQRQRCGQCPSTTALPRRRLLLVAMGNAAPWGHGRARRPAAPSRWSCSRGKMLLSVWGAWKALLVAYIFLDFYVGSPCEAVSVFLGAGCH